MNLRQIALEALGECDSHPDSASDTTTLDAIQDKTGRWHSERNGRFVKTADADAEFERRIAATINFSNYHDMRGYRHKTRVLYCTDRPICDEFEKAINALLGGKYVDDAYLEQLPELQYARKEKERIQREFERKHGVADPSLLNTAERKKLRDEVFAKWHSGSFRTGRRLDIVMGVPAAGKSTLIVNDLLHAHGSRLCDADDIKRDLPEYGNGLGADLVKTEANAINEKALLTAATRGENIIYPIIGHDEKIVRNVIQQAKSAGYAVHLHFAKADKRIAKGRLLNRFVRTGRLTELDFFDKAIDRSEAVFRKLANEADSATLTETYMKGI